MRNGLLLVAMIVATIAWTTRPTIAQQKLNIAVAEFEPRDVALTEAMAVSDFLRDDLVKMDLFNIVGRSEMKMILAQHKFEMSGCTDRECVIDMGRILHVDKIVSGNLARVGKLYYIVASVIDVQTGKIVFSEREKFDALERLSEIVDKLAVELANRLLGKRVPGIGPPAVALPKEPSLRKSEAGWKKLLLGSVLMVGGLVTMGLSIEDVTNAQLDYNDWDWSKEHETPYGWHADAWGTLKNTGNVPLDNVRVTVQFFDSRGVEIFQEQTFPDKYGLGNFPLDEVDTWNSSMYCFGGCDDEPVRTEITVTYDAAKSKLELHHGIFWPGVGVTLVGCYYCFDWWLQRKKGLIAQLPVKIIPVVRNNFQGIILCKAF